MGWWDIVNNRQHKQYQFELIPKLHIGDGFDDRVCAHIQRYCLHQAPASGHQEKYNSGIRCNFSFRNILSYLVMSQNNARLHT